MRLIAGISERSSSPPRGAVVFAKACELGLEGIVSKPGGAATG
jgi:hypothetical protein